MRYVCVYCGSSDEVPSPYRAAAYAMGEALAQAGLTVVYGGGRTGLMGALADGALAHGGEVIGVLPEHFNTPALAHYGVSRLEVVPDMHTRKARMAELADAFIALPGGYGTLEELFEALTWAQIGLHSKPIGLLNTAGYYDGLLHFIAHAQQEGFLYAEHRALLVSATEPHALLDALQRYRHPGGVARWLRQE